MSLGSFRCLFLAKRGTHEHSVVTCQTSAFRIVFAFTTTVVQHFDPEGVLRRHFDLGLLLVEDEGAVSEDCGTVPNRLARE